MIATEKYTTVKRPPVQKKIEREFADLVKYMVEQSEKRFINNVIDAMTQETVDKFADAQVGNFAARILKLASKFKSMVLDQFSNDRIKTFVSEKLKKSDKISRNLFYSKISDAIGIDTKQLLTNEVFNETRNALILETTEWIKRLRDETLEDYTANTLRVAAQGGGIDDLRIEVKRISADSKKRADFTARQQLHNFQSVMDDVRADALGITEAVWRTSKDERVRDSHKSRDGQIYDINKGCYSAIDKKWLKPAREFGCRCYGEYILPSLED